MHLETLKGPIHLGIGFLFMSAVFLSLIFFVLRRNKLLHLLLHGKVLSNTIVRILKCCLFSRFSRFSVTIYASWNGLMLPKDKLKSESELRVKETVRTAHVLLFSSVFSGLRCRAGSRTGVQPRRYMAQGSPAFASLASGIWWTDCRQTRKACSYTEILLLLGRGQSSRSCRAEGSDRVLARHNSYPASAKKRLLKHPSNNPQALEG
jgi:hypothetical protein